MKLCNAVILFRNTDDTTGISFTDNLKNRMLKFKPVSFTRFEPIELGSSMTKLQALKHLKTLSVYQDQYFQQLIDDKIGKYLNKIEINSNDVNSILNNVDTNIDVKV